MSDVAGVQVIVDQPLPLIGDSYSSDNSSSTPTSSSMDSVNGLTPTVIQEKAIPVPVIAVETIGTALNTQTRSILGTFTFSQVGALQIGKYVNGSSGEVKISPNGITATNVNGTTTFTLDGTTGNATFLGTVQAGSILSGSLTLGGSGNGNGIMTIADASGNAIIKGDNLGHHYYDTAGHELVRVNSGGFYTFDTTGNELMYASNSAINFYGINGNVIQLYNTFGGNIVSQMGYNQSATGQFTTELYAYGSLVMTGHNSNVLVGGLYVGINSPLYEDVQLESYKGNVIISAGGNINLTPSGSFQVNGVTKTAIVQTSEGYKALYCSESPEVWFFDFAPNKDSIDPLFLEATEGEIKTLKTEEGELLVFRKRKGYSAERFTPKTVEEFNRNNQFWAQAQTK